MAPCSSSVAQCPWTTQLYSDWDCSTRPDALRRCPQGCFFHPRQTSTSKTSCLQSPPLVLSSNERRAQARWLNVHGQLSSILTGTAPLGLMYAAAVPKGAFSIRDTPQPPKPRVSTLGSNWRRAYLLKLAGSIPVNKQMPLVRLRFCQWSYFPLFLLVSILTETCALVTNPFSTYGLRRRSSVAWCSTAQAQWL